MADGTYTEPNVLAYVCNAEHVQEFESNNYHMNFFKGKVFLYGYMNFFSVDRSSRASSDPCDEQDADFTNGGTGSGHLDPNNPDNWDLIDPDGMGGGSNGSCTWDYSITPCNYGYAYQHGPEPIYGGSYCSGSGTVMNITCGGEKSTDDLGCVNELDTGVNSQESPKDCVKLNHLLTVPAYSNALADIQTGSSGDSERGYDILDTDGVISTNYVPGTSGDVQLNHGGNIIGGIHNHTTDGYNMFSAEDIYKLYAYSVSNPTAQVKSISTTVVTEVGTFALTIDRRDMLAYILNTSSLGKDKLNDLLEEKYKKATTANDFKKALLDVFKEIKTDKGMPFNPVNLYEFDSFSNSFKLVTLDSNGEPKSETCH